MKKVIIGLTGASGSIYFKKTIEILSSRDYFIHVIASDNGKKVFEYELEENFEEFITKFDNVKLEQNQNMFSQTASGSFPIDGMMIIPCSMGTVGKIANGSSDSLLIRAADVCIKEQKKLVIAFREAPLSLVHLNNLTLQ